MAQKFKPSAIFGTNLAQMDGDSLYGYKKIGLTAGIKMAYVNKRSFDITMEMLLSQRGSSLNFTNNRPKENNTLSYIEIPLVFNVRDWYVKDKDYFKMRLDWGASYAHLIHAETIKFDASKFQKHDISWFIGGGMRFTHFWGLAVRYTSSLSKVYVDQENKINKFKSYFLTFRSEFYF
jgi:hypothetical protein